MTQYKMRYGIFHYRKDGYYHIRSALQVFATEGAAQKSADGMMYAQDGLNLVVRTLKWCKGHRDEEGRIQDEVNT